jgi:hypothetical protein
MVQKSNLRGGVFKKLEKHYRKLDLLEKGIGIGL